MDYKIQAADQVTEIFLSGRMTFVDHEKFRRVLIALESGQGQLVVFDLSGLDFVDSSGLGMFMIARDSANKRKLEFRLRGARDDVKRLMTVAKFHNMFTIEP